MKTKICIFLFVGACFLEGLYLRNGQLSFKRMKEVTTQVTNNEPLRCFCKKATADRDVFRTFKSDPIYNLFYENTTFEEGKFFLEKLKTHFPDLLKEEILEKVRKLDMVGDPMLFPFESIGLFSATTLRYLKSAGDLQQYFGNLKKIKVIEIGGGDGGQCKILHDLFAIESYTIIDLPEILDLAKKHLETLGIRNIHYLTPEEVSTQSCDLLMSHYTFTESNAPLQKKYLEKLFSKAKRGYVFCNFVPKHFRVRPMPKNLLLKKMQTLQQNYKILPEEPQTGKDNFLLIWSNANA